jgi:hypothetical protein
MCIEALYEALSDVASICLITARFIWLLFDDSTVDSVERHDKRFFGINQSGEERKKGFFMECRPRQSHVTAFLMKTIRFGMPFSGGVCCRR